MKLLGVNIHELTKRQARDKAEVFLNTETPHMIFTPNPEMIVDAQRDIYFKEVLNESDMNICDGFGLQLFSLFRLHRIPGIDFMQDLLAMAERKKKSVYFLGSGSKDVIYALLEETRKAYPDLHIAGGHPGLKIDQVKADGRCILALDEKENNDIIGDMVMAQPEIVFVAFGHRKQEKWIYENIKDIPGLRIAMGVGGSFDFLSGKIKRAPKLIRMIGMEWLYRLISQPKRLKRILKATFVFMWYAVFKKVT